MTMLNAMVASSKKQAEAMIAWLRLDPKEWEPIAYGDAVTKLYSNAKLVRPSEGVEQAHSNWVLEKLVPNLCLAVSTVPPQWRIPQEHVA
ncbi:hypothetical protein ABIE79_010056 [Bradyrhizobium diazoefficiens]